MRAADMHRSLAETLENCRRLRQRLVEENELLRITKRDKEYRSCKPPDNKWYVLYVIDYCKTINDDLESSAQIHGANLSFAFSW